MEGTLQTALRWVLALLAQSWIFHHLVVLDGWVTPLFHLYGLVLLPLRMRPVTYLLAGGLMGLGVDLLNFGGGLFTAAGLVSGGLQPLIARLLAPREGYEADAEVGPQPLGWLWWLTYTFLIVVVHAVWLFALEAGRWGLVPKGLGQAATSALATSALIVIVRTLFMRNARRR
jgi:hypothetical protein